MKTLPATIYDIAREAKVGIATVSRVFNNHPSVSVEARKKVLQAAEKLNYRPHPYARGLARKRTNIFLAVIPFFATSFFLEILRGIQSVFSDKDIDLFVHGVHHPDDVEHAVGRVVTQGRFDGVIYLSMSLPDQLAQMLIARKTPMVLVDGYHPQFDSFAVNNVEGARNAIQHLLSLGHRHIGMLSANLESKPARERLQGYRQALAEANVPFDQSLVHSSSSSELDGFTEATGRMLIKKFIGMGVSRPSAVFASSDIQAAGALTEIRDAGLRCPDDIALMGFDDIALAGMIGLSTMRQPLYEMGWRAAQRLLEHMADTGRPILHETFIPDLVIRPSSGRGVTRPAHASPSKEVA